MTAPQMTTSPRRGPLALVSDTDSDETGQNDALSCDAECPAQTVLEQWAPEHQLVGALMHLPAERVKALTSLVPDNAVTRPMTRWAYQLIRGLTDAGRNPDPVIVLATGKHQPASDALDPTQPPTPKQHHDLAVYLAGAYTETICAEVAADYARQVLDDAYRRAVANSGARMQQLAENSSAERGDLTDQFAAIRDELADLWRRAEQAAKPETR